MLDDKQVNLIRWMFNVNVIYFKLRNDEETENDIRLLKEAIQRNFPLQFEELIKLIKPLKA